MLPEADAAQTAGAVSAAVGCPPLVRAALALVRGIPFHETVSLPAADLSAGVQALGYAVTQLLSDWACRDHVPLLEAVRNVDWANARFISALQPDTPVNKVSRPPPSTPSSCSRTSSSPPSLCNSLPHPNRPHFTPSPALRRT